MESGCVSFLLPGKGMRKAGAFLTHSCRGSSRWALCCVVWGPVVRQGIVVGVHDRAKVLA